MIKTKKQMFILIGAFALVMLLGTVTYAFFNYTRTGSANIIKTGRINFNSEQGTAINLTNMFPIDPTETGIMNDSTKVGTVTINVTGDTTYSDGIEYLVSAVNVTNAVGSKTLPISINVSVENNTGNNPATSLGISDSDYFTNRGSSVETSIYKVLATDAISEGDQLVVGYIKSGQDGVDGNIVIKAYIDKNKVGISDTYPEETVREVVENYSTSACETALTGVTNASTICASAEALEGAIGNLTEGQLTALVTAGVLTEYTNGTQTSFGEGRTILTTTEWNSLQTNGVSFQVRVEANEGIWVEDLNAPICKRVTNVAQLHTESCINTSSSYCQYNDYALNDVITYGNAKSLGNTLTVGDAFDCKVSKTGDYTERFYYVSPYYDTETLSFDNNYATLIYYSNTISGVASDGGSAYYTGNNENWHGPVAAINNLPTVGQ